MKPIVLAMLIADHYYRDSSTGKSSAFPTKHGSCAVYISITDIATSGELQLLFHKADGTFSMDLPSWTVECPEQRHSVVEIGGNIAGLPLPEEGEYEFVVRWNGMDICSRRFYARLIEINRGEY